MESLLSGSLHSSQRDKVRQTSKQSVLEQQEVWKNRRLGGVIEQQLQGGLPRHCREGTPKLRREWRVKIGEAGTSPEVGKGGSKDQTGEWGCTAVLEEDAGAQ